MVNHQSTEVHGLESVLLLEAATKKPIGVGRGFDVNPLSFTGVCICEAKGGGYSQEAVSGTAWRYDWAHGPEGGGSLAESVDRVIRVSGTWVTCSLSPMCGHNPGGSTVSRRCGTSARRRLGCDWT